MRGADAGTSQRVQQHRISFPGCLCHRYVGKFWYLHIRDDLNLQPPALLHPQFILFFPTDPFCGNWRQKKIFESAVAGGPL